MITDAEVPELLDGAEQDEHLDAANMRILKKCGGNGSTPQPSMQS